jgi:hypothetical protein
MPTHAARGHARLPWIVVAVVVGGGAALWAALGAEDEGPPATPPKPATVTDRLVAEAEGEIRDWLLAVPAQFSENFVETQAQLIARAAPDIRFFVVHSGGRGHRALIDRVGRLDPKALRRVTFQRAAESVSPWVRDYFLVGRAPDGSRLAWLHHPEHYRGASGPWQSLDPRDFTDALEGVRTIQTNLWVDGGGVVADEERIFAARTPLFAGRMAPGGRGDPQGIARAIEVRWGKPVTWVEAGPISPSGHVDTFLLPTGERTAVMGSASLASSLLRKVSRGERSRFIDRFRAFTTGPDAPRDAPIDHEKILDHLTADGSAPRRRAALDAVRAQLMKLGYRQVPVPYLVLDPARYGLFATITYTNGVIDVRDGRKTVYLPVYGLGALDEAATKAWAQLGYRVVAIDALGAAIHGGAVRCLSQVIRR